MSNNHHILHKPISKNKTLVESNHYFIELNQPRKKKFLKICDNKNPEDEGIEGYRRSGYHAD